MTEPEQPTVRPPLVVGWYLIASTYHPEYGHRNLHQVAAGQDPNLNVALAVAADRFMRS